MKVSDARTEFEKRKKDIADVDDIAGTFLQWCNYINRFAYRELSNIMPEQYIASQVYTLVSGVAGYTLPTDFQDISPQGTGLYEISASGVDTENRLPLTSYGSTKNGAYITSTQIVFTPIPTSSRQYRFRYIPLLDDLTGEDDDLIIPQRFSYHLMDVLDACYNVWDEDQNAEVFNDERVIRTLNEMISFINPVGQVESLPDFSCDF